jgi:hypothetical protein
MTGVGRTTFAGDRVEEFKVEVVGLLENILPRRNLILVRCSGEPLSRIGIAQGMSGTPVYVRGKLVGAIAYAWGFVTEPVAGVTPIEEMLEIPPGEADGGRATAAAALPGLVPEPHVLRAFFADLLTRSGALPGSGVLPRPLALPVHAAGFPPEILERLGESLGARLVPTGGAPAGIEAGLPRLEPGSTLGVQLVRGDLDLTAVGTVTAVDGDAVFAFGHPFLNIGSTAMPMTGAWVHLIVPSLQSSFKVASPTGEIGAIRQDRAVGLRGRLGDRAPMIPVRLEIGAPGAAAAAFRFDLVDDPLLTPLLLNYAVLGALTSAEKGIGPMTLRVREGSSIQLRDYPPAELDNFYSGDFAAPFASGLSAYLLYVLMNNEYVSAEVVGINLLVDFLDDRRSARIEEVWADRERVRAGETVAVSVSVRPFRARPIPMVLDLPIPRETPPGRLLVRVADGLTLARLETEGEPAGIVPRDFDQLLWLINQIRSFNRIYAIASLVDEEGPAGGSPLPGLPPSVAQVLRMPQAGGDHARRRRPGLLEESAETDYAVTGYRKIWIEVVP